MSRHRRVIAKYLERYADPSATPTSQRLCELGQPDYSHVLVVPAHREPATSIERVVDEVQTCDGRFLLIVVSNASAGMADTQRRAHLDSETELLQRHRWISLQGHTYLSCWANCDCLLITRSRDGLLLPEKQGVGLARKIGTDVGVALYQLGGVRSPWLLQTDADVRLPGDYLSRATERQCESVVAMIYPFCHRDTVGVEEGVLCATLQYEAYLRYFVLGLAVAGSPYAFHSLGSTLAIDVDAYAHVRGFPQRQAGEDFYLLNKLLKLGGIYRLSGAPVVIGSRVSDRAPFGTGPAVTEAIAGKARLWESPSAFVELRRVLEHIRSCCRAEVLLSPARLDSVEGLTEVLKDAVARGPTPEHAERRVMTWFDGLKTMRLVRRSGGSGAAPAQALTDGGLVELEDGPFGISLRGQPSSTEWSTVCARLASMEPRGTARLLGIPLAGG